MSTISLIKSNLRKCNSLLEATEPNATVANVLGELVTQTSTLVTRPGIAHYLEPLTQHKELLDQLLADIYNVDVKLSRDQIVSRLKVCLQCIQECAHLDSIQHATHKQDVRITGVEATEIWELLDNIACEQSGMSGFSRAADKYAGILKAKLGIEDATID